MFKLKNIIIMNREETFKKLALFAEQSIERYTEYYAYESGSYKYETLISEVIEKDKRGNVLRSEEYGLVTFEVDVTIVDDELSFYFSNIKAQVYDKFGGIMTNISREVNKLISVKL